MLMAAVCDTRLTKNREVELIIQHKVSLEDFELKLYVIKLLYCSNKRQWVVRIWAFIDKLVLTDENLLIKM